MTLSDLGITKEIIDLLADSDQPEFIAGRVTQEHKERYIVSTGENEYEAEITGNLRYSAASRADFPAVGDWVTMAVYDKGMAIIHRILPRKSVLERQTVGKSGEKQILSTNVDYALIVQSIENNFNVNRLERYLTMCYSAHIEPVLVISKIDLADEITIQKVIEELAKRDKKVKYILTSNVTGEGIDKIVSFIKRGKTYCVIGSSGVGKSSLINNLLEKQVLKTGEISQSNRKGRHISDHRELFVLKNGGVIIDNPGMRELGITENDGGIKTTFQEIEDLSLYCKFPDCKHVNESGCAVLNAVEAGIIDKKSLENYMKIVREQQLFKATVAEKRKKERQFGRIIKNYFKLKKKNDL